MNDWALNMDIQMLISGVNVLDKGCSKVPNVLI